MAEEREYIITLKPGTDIDQFYDDMESSYGDTEIPDRQVECAYRRPTSRSTHYFLTDDEAQQVSNDSRVESITLPHYELDLEVKPCVAQTSSNWNKSSTNNTNDVNWGLLRGYERATRQYWGSDGTVTVSGTVNLTNIGRNVDVVIVDGHLASGHPEWYTNADGSGSSRFNPFNWFQYNSQVRGSGVAAGTYVYDFVSGADDNNAHGNNVASIAAGSSNGWARGANIYNICPYATTANNYTNWTYDLINFIRYWHKNKPVNPATGRRNPTICNNSWGLQGSLTLSDISQIVYQGVTYNQPAGGWTTIDRRNFGLVAAVGSTMKFMSRDSSLDADIVDAINDGIIMVGAAGNYYMYNEVPSGVNYNNRLVSQGISYYYMRGSSPGAAAGCICVSAVDGTVQERKADFSNAGPRTDIFASGSNIMGASYVNGIADSRNSNFKKQKLSGTSQASPQVTGLIACALETYPNMTPSQALAYIKSTATKNSLYDSNFSVVYGSSNYTSYNLLYNGPNAYAAYKSERGSTGQIYPKPNNFVRPSVSGQIYPRHKIRRYG